MKKIIFALIIFLFITFKVNALEINSKNVILYNLNENEVIYSLNADKETSVASLTKIMTTIVALENIDNLEETVIMTKSMFEGLNEANAAQIGLKIGQKVTYRDLIYGMFISSGADATRGIALSLAGSEKEYASWMNLKAKEIGLIKTNYINTTGLDEKNQYSTVGEVAKLLIYALKNEEFKKVFTTTSYRLKDGSKTLYSTLRKNASNFGINVDYIEGSKTGYTFDAGRCLASVAYDEKNNIEYLLVTTNAQNSNTRAYHIEDASNIYSYYFENYKYQKIVSTEQIITKLPTKYGKVSEVEIYPPEEVLYYLNNNFNKSDITLKYNGLKVIKTSMNAGEKLGEVEVLYQDEVIKKFDILLNEKVEFSIFIFLKENIIIVSLVFIIISLLICLKIFKKSNKKRRK